MDRFSLSCKSEHDMDKLAHIFSYYISDIVERNVLLALWTVEQNQLSDIITLVAKCSLEIQEKFGIYHTREGQDLQLKIGLSAGRISQVIVGDEQRQYLLVIGRDVDGVQLAQRLAQANEIVLSWNCWKLCEQYMFEVEIMREDEAVKLRDMRISDPFDFDEHFDKCLDYLPHYRTSADILRTALELDPDSALEQTLRKHIMKSLLKKEAALYISTVIEKGGGQLSRIFMFDKVSTKEFDTSALKGCMFLCVFGLPGDKKPDECAHALESSFSIFSFCWENLAETKLVSISITNGPVFCGMVGAIARHEYTEKMYEYLGHRRCIMFGKRHLARERNQNHPLLDREKELEAFQMAQQRCLHLKKGQAVLYEGGKGYGKSQLLAEINFLAQKEGHRGLPVTTVTFIRVLPLKLKEADSKQRFYAIQTLMAIFFEIDTCPACYRQECLFKQLHGMVEEPLHCLFNDLFFVKAVRETPLIFLIDEAQYMDAASWEFLGTLLSSVPIIMVMTLTPTFTLCGWAQHFLQSPQAILVPISKLAETSLLRMACWELGVVSIPQELQMCFGNPFYCEVLCQDLLSKNILLFHDLQKEEEETSKWETLSEIAVNQLDQLNPEEQLLVKCAAVIGHSFHIDLLQHLLPGWSESKLLQVLRALVDIHVLCWCSKSQELPAEPILVPSSIEIIEQTKEKRKPDLACRCGSCQGGDFVPFHRFAICSAKSSSGTSRFCSYRDTGSILTRVITDKLQLPSPQDSFQFQTKSPRSQEAFTNEHYRTEEEFLDQVNRRLAQTNLEKDMLTTKPCHCDEILKLVLSPLTQHCLVIGETTCAFYYLLEAAAASLDLSDNYMHKVKICQFEEATFCRLRSEVCFNMGQITLAKKLARQALRLLKRSFPWTWFGVIFQTFLEKYWRSCSQSQPLNNTNENKKKLAVLQQRVHCLSLLWQLYNLEATASSRRFACLATLMQKNSAKEFASEAQVVSTYVALSQLSQNMGDREKWLHCEQMAIQKSTLCWFSREGLLATAQLMQALAYTKLCLGHLDFSIKLDLLLYGEGWLCRPFGECLHFIQHYEHSCILTSDFNVMLGVHASLAMCLLTCELAALVTYQNHNSDCPGGHKALKKFAQDSQWNLFEHHFSRARQLVKRTNASLFGSHGFVRFLECHVLMLQKIPEGVFKHTPSETHRQALKYIKEFFSRCVTCPVYHQIWIEGKFLEENNSFEGNLGIQRFVRVADVKENKDEEEIQEYIC
ncbi:adenylate cyclase type 10-like protein [Camelus ferus]|nr:adenylate cyclase type 10-like protein [Camelus ferus]